MIKYENFKTFLKEKDCELITTLDEFLKSPEITYTCPKGHNTNIKSTSFNNKRSQEKENICKHCKLFEENKKKIYFNTGHLLTFLDTGNTSNCKYLCGNCGAERTSTTSNLKKQKSTRYCSLCFKQEKKDINVVNKELYENNINYVCIEYINSHNMKMKCKRCSNIFETRRSLLNRGRGCPKCMNERRKETNIKVYGSENVMHNSDIFEIHKKRMFNKKEYTFKGSGNTVTIQGYEHHCLNDLLDNYNITEDQIYVESSKFPIFKYMFEGTYHRYYPDIMIIDKDDKMSFIEVKSSWTLTREVEKNEAKWSCVRDMGYKLDVMVYNEKGTLIEVQFMNIE